MPSNRSRRALVTGALCGIGALATGGYAWNRYANRNRLRFRPLEAVDESNESVAITVAVRSDQQGKHERTVDLEATGWRSDRVRVTIVAGDSRLEAAASPSDEY